jgi:hypothetical protein
LRPISAMSLAPAVAPVVRSVVIAVLVLAGSVSANALTWGPSERYVYAHASILPYHPHPGQTEVPTQDPQTTTFATDEAGHFTATAAASRRSLFDDEWGDSYYYWRNSTSITQVSTIGTNAVEASLSGHAGGSGDIGAPSAYSDGYLSITFSTNHAMGYAISGSFSTEFFWFSSAGASLVGSQGSVLDLSLSGFETGVIASDGILPADTYTFTAFLFLRCECGESGLTYPDLGSLSLSLVLAPIPEPSTLALMGLGLAGLAVRRRK